ncbi:hypothetical protein PHLGIDRAFT_70777 [Phlebiopsis gigantea 11061_1 CR5-6]|uniref:NADP-dependent oxidoreductase domain-containing protein n=1 Tax=Phlebiopsis gigantea (strain 11061_1 CR5-6) TaxID=745531 RepID=A0A0C3RZ99_PHLG1|nr:hypothetical protein PHLGIDRAFT_70777 [Phlebiopsis gigantea 11061_1 CR5-6]
MSVLPTRKLGKDLVTSIGYGAMGISALYGPVDSMADRLKFLDELYARGCTNWDTANVYGDSEVLIGKWFQKTGRRNEIFLASKFGITGDVIRPSNGEPEYVKACMEQSLKRLGVDYVDLYYLHRPDIKVPIEKTVGAMAELVKEGKTRYLGLSECSSSTIRRAHAVHPIAAVQMEYSLFTLDIEADILKTCRELGIAVVAYSPLGRGLLTGQYKSMDDFEPNDFRRTIPRYSNENFPKILELVNAVATIGKNHDATAGQVALAWLLAQGDDIVPIPGTKKLKYLDENLGAARVRLSSDEIAEIRLLVENMALIGSRYDAVRMSVILQDTPPM